MSRHQSCSLMRCYTGLSPRPKFDSAKADEIPAGGADDLVVCVGGPEAAHWSFVYGFFSAMLFPNMKPISATARGWFLFTPVGPNASPGVMLLAWTQERSPRKKKPPY
jgi:hypothetical protein